jgi:hypothetical protein
MTRAWLRHRELMLRPARCPKSGSPLRLVIGAFNSIRVMNGPACKQPAFNAEQVKIAERRWATPPDVTSKIDGAVL